MAPIPPDSAPQAELAATPPAARPRPDAIDPVAVDAVLRRLARNEGAPWLHEEVARRMAERLGVIRLRPTRVLRWSGWIGGGAQALRQAYPDAAFEVAEPTDALRDRSATAAVRPWWQALRRGTRERALRDHEVADGRAGLLWANMVLQGVADPPALMARWHRALAVDGFVMFSCFGPDTLKELRRLYRAAGWPVPAAAFIDMHDLGDMMVHAGFADPVMDQEPLRLTWADAASMRAELRGLGGNVAQARFGGLRTPRWRDDWRRRIEGDDAVRPAATFEIVYGHAFKPAPRARLASETAVSLEDMRRQLRSGPTDRR